MLAEVMLRLAVDESECDDGARRLFTILLTLHHQ